MRLIFVRHGETDRNTNVHHQTKGPAQLNVNGHRQAEAAANRLKDEKIDCIWSSDMPRAIDTADIIARHHPNAERMADHEIRERDHGVFSHRSHAEMDTAMRASGLGFRDWKPEGGESLRDVKRRAEAWFIKLKATHPNDTVLVVSHGMFLFTILEVAVESGADTDREEFAMYNGGVTILDIGENGPARVIHLNDAAHLEGTAPRPSRIKEMMKSDPHDR